MYSVLIAEDEHFVAESIIRCPAWMKCGFSICHIARNGIEAMDKLEEFSPDVAFVDIKMPGMNGLEVIAEAKRRKFETLFVILSGHAEFAYAQRAMRCGAVDYCLKPLDPSELESILMKLAGMLSKEQQGEKGSAWTVERIPSNPIHSTLAQNALAYIDSNFNRHIDLQTIARHLHVSVNHLCAVFHKDTGKTVNEYLTCVRMVEARKLLIDTRLQIGEIAGRCGYDSLFYFCRIFKKINGVTPSEFRKF